MMICNLKSDARNFKIPNAPARQESLKPVFFIIIWKFIETADHKTKIRAPSSADLPPPEVDFYALAPPV